MAPTVVGSPDTDLFSAGTSGEGVTAGSGNLSPIIAADENYKRDEGENPPPLLPTAPGKLDPEPLGNQGSISSKTVQKQDRPDWAFEQVNDVTVKITDGRGSLVPASHGQWRGYQTTLGVAWLMSVGSGLWIVRIGDRESPPMKLSAAKTYALEMLKGQRDGRLVTDPILDLNILTVRIMDAAAPTTRPGNSRPVVNLADAPPHLVACIVRIECAR